MNLTPRHSCAGRNLKSKIPAFAGMTLLVLALTACATAVQPKNQRIQFTSVGGGDPMCILETPLNKYKVYPPQAVQVERSRYTLVVDCTANEGKHRRLLIQPEHNPTSTYMQGPLQVVDRITGSAWQYPPYIRIDFDYDDPFIDPQNPMGAPPAQSLGRDAIDPARVRELGQTNK